MKIAIITYDEYINIPYIHKYEELIADNGYLYDIILWDRRGCDYKHKGNHYVFRSLVKKSKISKIVPFLLWRRYVLQILKSNQYDKLIVLTTIPAILICDFLVKSYAEKFFFDIRDYTYEGFWPYRKLVNWIVKKSAVTSISSRAFMQFLVPSSKIVVTHNLSNDGFVQEYSRPITYHKHITLGFVGGVRYYEENCRLLAKLKDSPHFKLRYVGKVHPGCDLQAFCQKNSIDNVDFFPAYDNAQKPAIYQELDLINAVYGNNAPEVTLSLPNRLYDSAIFKKPIVVSCDTYLASIVEQYHLGVAIDTERDDIEAVLNGYLETFNVQQFEDGCRAFLNLAREDETIAGQKIAYFLKEK